MIGTYYHHADPLTYIQGIMTPDGEPKYLYRLKPGSDDGTATASPVFVSQEAMERSSVDSDVQLPAVLDPSPLSEMKLNPDFFLPIERRMIPKDVYRFMLVDQAGDLASAKVRVGRCVRLLGRWCCGRGAVHRRYRAIEGFHRGYLDFSAVGERSDRSDRPDVHQVRHD